MNYTCAILWTKTRTSLALAYANRSACLYKLGMHKECITDMNRALAHGYPTEKRPNLIERRDQLLKLKRPERGSFEKTPKIPKSQKSRRNPSARNCIEVQNNEEFGRHIVATRDIRIGDVLSVEEPFACVVEKEVLFHCHECAVLCYNPIPCEDCTRVLFCSEACKKRAASTYHKYECAILASLVEYGMKPALLALKVALLAKQDGYKEVHKLKPATEERSDLFFISTVAAVLFHFLESHTDLFRHGNENHREDFKEIMLLQLQVCPLNAIKIYECVPNPKMHESDAFAAGLYAFASLFNHSCCHNVERTHHGSTIVLRAANTIRKGQQCFISYGFQYDTGSLASRQECLRSAYYFICNGDALHQTRAKMKDNCCASCRRHFREYCSRSSVHGVQYLAEEGRPTFERIWWSLVLVISLSVCTFSIYQVYKKWEQSPVIVTLANSGRPIYEIPFPAVTICPESKSDESVFNYTDIIWRWEEMGEVLTPLEKTRFEYMSLICNHYPHLHPTKIESFPQEFFDVVDDLKPKFALENCIYTAVDFNCGEQFVPIFTDEGICYSWNMLDRSEIFRSDVAHYKNFHQVGATSDMWSLEGGYRGNSGPDSYPYRAFIPGAVFGLKFNIATSHKNRDYACRNSIWGYKIALHTPATVPRPSRNFFRIPLGQSIAAAIKPNVITTSKRIQTYSPKRRNCYFETERPLRYFQKYTSSNCQVECITNYTLKFCNCVNFFMPSVQCFVIVGGVKMSLQNVTNGLILGENGTKICGSGKTDCMKMVNMLTPSMDLIKHLNGNFYEVQSLNNMTMDCNCLPLCSDLNYEVEVTQSDWGWKMWLGPNATSDQKELSIGRVARSH
ncbi:ASC and/or SET domain containing protein, partial [Asbolus verrucosus]